MAEFTNVNIQTIAAGQNVPLTETAISSKPCIVHREGSGLVTLRGLTNQCRAVFKISYGGNIAIPTGGLPQRFPSTAKHWQALRLRSLRQQSRIILISTSLHRSAYRRAAV